MGSRSAGGLVLAHLGDDRLQEVLAQGTRRRDPVVPVEHVVGAAPRAIVASTRGLPAADGAAASRRRSRRKACSADRVAPAVRVRSTGTSRAPKGAAPTGPAGPLRTHRRLGRSAPPLKGGTTRSQRAIPPAPQPVGQCSAAPAEEVVVSRVVHFEVQVDDVERATECYRAVFGVFA